MKKVLVVLPVKDSHKEKLEKAGEGCEFIYSSYTDVTRQQVQEANIIIGNAPAGLIEGSRNLELLHLNSAGTDGYTTPGVLAPQTILTNSTGAYSKAVAEHCFIQALMMMKKLHLYRDNQRENRWEDEGTVTSITDATVLVVGLGDIGLHFAQMAKALGAKKVIGVKRRQSALPEGVDELYLTEDLDKVLPEADIIASFLPGMPSTTHMYTVQRFEMMKDTAIFVNGGRGSAVASDVLYRALSEKMIMAAAVDVTEPEPLPAESPLWQLDNLCITPHISGFFHLPETFERIVDISAYNLRAYLAGEPLKNIVDFETGYRK